MPINDRIWLNDPPASSYPDCIAVKCAALQSAEAEEVYLRALREAVMVEGKNIAKQEVLLEVAGNLSLAGRHVFDLQRFEKDLLSGAGYQPFRNDLQQTKFHKIGRFPTLTISRNDGGGVMIVGYRPFPILMNAIAQVAPELAAEDHLISGEDYKEFWGDITDREINEVSST